MATYIVTIKFSEKGLQAIQETTTRGAAFKSSAKKLGVKVVSQFWTLGAVDGLLILEAADETVLAAALLQLEMLGNVHTSTARAFNAAEMDAILKKVGG